MSGVDDSGTFEGPNSTRLVHQGGISVELFDTGAVPDELAEQLVRLRAKSCLPVRSADTVHAQLKTNPVIVGLRETEAGVRPEAALYGVPMRKWAPTRQILTDDEKYRTFAALAEAKFLCIAELDCTQWAVGARFTWPFLRDALKLVRRHATEGCRVLTFTPASGLQRFCRERCVNGGDPARDFWHAMSLVVDSSRFETLSDLAACFGNLQVFVEKLGSCDASGWEELRSEHGENLNVFLKALATTFALELYEQGTGQDLCMASRFHRYHGARLADVIPSSDPENIDTLGVVLHFEYRYEKMATRRERYAELRRSRRQ